MWSLQERQDKCPTSRAQSPHPESRRTGPRRPRHPLRHGSPGGRMSAPSPPPAHGGPEIPPVAASSSRSPRITRSCSRAAGRSDRSPSPTRPGERSTPTGDNAVLVCHALTGDSHVAGPAGDGHPTPGWWDRMVGPGAPVDTDRYFVVCANVLGGCQGTTGPASDHPADGRPYGSRFPVVSDPRHGPHPGRAGQPSRHRAVAVRHRRIDGRHAGARVGRHVPRPGAVA